MNRMVSFLLGYLIIGFPFVVAEIIWGEIYLGGQEKIVIVTNWFLQILSLNLILWFCMLGIFVILSVTSRNVQEKFLLKLANIKERDEREELIIGRASRVTYLSTLSLSILLLFFSIFTLKIYQVPLELEKSIDSSPITTIAISANLNFLNQYEITTPKKEETLFDSHDFMLSPIGVLFILIAWQFLIFNVATRKEMKKMS